jgi:hypothetical protein
MVLVTALCTFPVDSRAQGSAGSGGKFEPRSIVDMPTAGMLDKGSYGIDLNFYQEGGVLLGFSVGVFDRLNLGLSYGGSHLIGGDTPVMNEIPGLAVKVRILEESTVIPALAIGFDNQGNDGYIKELSRYLIKSPGFYAVLSKNYSLLGFLSLHGGINYSLERTDGDKDVNGYVGVEKTIGPFVSILVEYNLARNDNGENSLGKGSGYLNAAFKWSISGGLTLGVDFKDLLKNGGEDSVAKRTISLEYIRFF